MMPALFAAIHTPASTRRNSKKLI
jgi:hypothetical protein